CFLFFLFLFLLVSLFALCLPLSCSILLIFYFDMCCKVYCFLPSFPIPNQELSLSFYLLTSLLLRVSLAFLLLIFHDSNHFLSSNKMCFLIFRFLVRLVANCHDCSFFLVEC